MGTRRSGQYHNDCQQSTLTALDKVIQGCILSTKTRQTGLPKDWVNSSSKGCSVSKDRAGGSLTSRLSWTLVWWRGKRREANAAMPRRKDGHGRTDWYRDVIASQAGADPWRPLDAKNQPWVDRQGATSRIGGILMGMRVRGEALRQCQGCITHSRQGNGLLALSDSIGLHDSAIQ